MFKLIITTKRRAGMSLEEFKDYYDSHFSAICYRIPVRVLQRSGATTSCATTRFFGSSVTTGPTPIRRSIA